MKDSLQKALEEILNEQRKSDRQDNLYKAKGFGDPTNGGKLMPVHIVDKNGHHTIRYKTLEQIKEMQSGSDHQHVAELAAGHRFTHSKNGVGTITKVKGHDGKGGHELSVAYDNGKKGTAYAHNVEHHNPLEDSGTVPTKQIETKSTPEKKTVEATNTQTEEQDDFDDTMLTPGERMHQWEQMVYRLTKPGTGVNAALAYGKGGVGKTFGAMKIIEGVKNANGELYEEGRDYVKFTGSITPSALYETLYKNNGKLIIFDDCDDVFNDSDAINILKGACDTSDKRTITRAKASTGDDPYPDRFRFTGKVAFISNLNLDHLAEKGRNKSDIEALLTRADVLNLRMTNSQTVDLIKTNILNSKGFNFRNASGRILRTTPEEKQEVYDFLNENKHKLSELSVRTMQKVNAIRNLYTKKGLDWKSRAEAMLVTGKQDSLDVNQRFETYGDFVEMAARGDVKSVIAYGRGGIGKTYTAISRLDEMGFIDAGDDDFDASDEDNQDLDKQYIHYQGGKFTAKGLYETMFRNNGRLIVVDDADAALLDKQAQGILKGALDSSGDGQISWITSDAAKKKTKALPKQGKSETDEDYEDRMTAAGLMDEDGNVIDGSVPDTFKFTGRMVFISNLESEKVAQPLQSRALTVNTTMTREEAIQRFRHVAKQKREKGVSASNNVHSATHDDTDQVLDYFESLKDQIPDRHFNNRTVDKMLSDKMDSVRTGVDWRKTLKTKLLKGFYVQLNKFQGELIEKALEGLLESNVKSNNNNNNNNNTMKNIEKAALSDLLKGGEGSRGGNIVGHTQSGKPIYSNSNHASHNDFTSEDHSDAAKKHADLSSKAYKKGNVEESNREHSEKMRHMQQSQNKKVVGKTKSGKDVHHDPIHDNDFDSKDHADASKLHRKLADKNGQVSHKKWIADQNESAAKHHEVKAKGHDTKDDRTDRTQITKQEFDKIHSHMTKHHSYSGGEPGKHVYMGSDEASEKKRVVQYYGNHNHDNDPDSPTIEHNHDKTKFWKLNGKSK